MSRKLYQQQNDSVQLAVKNPEEIPVVVWAAKMTKELISKYGTQVIDSQNSNGVPLLCDAIVNQQFDSAELLLEYAREHNRFVILDTGKCATLDWAIEHGAVDIAKFVLDHLVNKSLTVDESCSILTNYLLPLIKEFPSLMKDYLTEDKFSFEYGRISVPYSLFKNPNYPVAMTTDEALTDWASLDNTVAKEFWIRNSTEHGEELANASDLHVEAVAKFLCINQHTVRSSSSDDTIGIQSRSNPQYRWNHFLRLLPNTVVPVETFGSESLKTFANWVHYGLPARFGWFHFLDIVVAGIFTYFATSRALQEDDQTPRERMIFLSLIMLTLLLHVLTYIMRASRIRFASVVLLFCLTVHFAISAHHTEISAIATSIECILCFILPVEATMHYDAYGPFVSMVKHSFQAITLFAILSAYVLVGFTLAFQVLTSPRFYKANEDTDNLAAMDERSGENGTRSLTPEADSEDFASFSHVIKILFHACIGNFDGEVFRSADGLVGVWKAILFNAFLFLGGIVLINLLIAILGDIYDRVKLKEEAELIRCRADIAGDALSSVVHRIITAEEKNRACLGWHAIRAIPGRLISRTRTWFYGPKISRHAGRKYFHYLTPVKETGKEKDVSWLGRIREVEKTVEKEMRKHLDKGMADIRSSVQECTEPMGELATAAAQTESDIAMLKAQMIAVQDTLSYIRQKLDQFSSPEA